jgi:beta-glucanase (GH16 family)
MCPPPTIINHFVAGITNASSGLHVPELIDGQAYELVFSKQFEILNRVFYPGDDPCREPVNLWYGATNDLEWYNPGRITTKDGKLSILVEIVENHGLRYRSGMLQSWNEFCFSGGYAKVSITLPGA